VFNYYTNLVSKNGVKQGFKLPFAISFVTIRSTILRPLKLHQLHLSIIFRNTNPLFTNMVHESKFHEFMDLIATI